MPQIVLTWDASVTPGVSYTVNRAPALGGPYTPLVTGLSGLFNDSTLTYSDEDVIDGTTYFYNVEAVLGGVSSAPSNTIGVSVPNIPQPPSNLKGTAQA